MTQYFRRTAGVLTGPQLNGWRRKCLMLQIRHSVSKWYWNYQWVKTVLWYRKLFKSYGSGHETAAVLLPGFAIKRQPQFCDLTHILSTFVDSEHEIATFCDSSYITISDIQSIIKKHDKEFSILSLNTQSINAKFDKIYAIVNNLSSLGHYFGAICLQETWLRNNVDISLFSIPGYRLIHQGSKCTKHGGLIIYLNERYSYKLRNLYTGSDIWEGLFVDVTGYNLRRPLTIGNIYRPPHDNNSNENIGIFLTELSPIIEILQKENMYGAVVGDFNINLLQIGERETFEEFFDLMCTNNFFPKNYSPDKICQTFMQSGWPNVL